MFDSIISAFDRILHKWPPLRPIGPFRINPSCPVPYSGDCVVANWQQTITLTEHSSASIRCKCHKAPTFPFPLTISVHLNVRSSLESVLIVLVVVPVSAVLIAFHVHVRPFRCGINFVFSAHLYRLSYAGLRKFYRRRSAFLAGIPGKTTKHAG